MMRRLEWIVTLVALQAFCAVTVFGMGNGSSGVGNGITAIDSGMNVNAFLPNDYVETQGDQVLDKKTKEPLIKLDKISKDDLARYGRRLSHSQLGGLDGFEYIPEISDPYPQNFWIVCDKGEKCLKMSPLSKTNPKVPAVIGALTHQAK